MGRRTPVRRVRRHLLLRRLLLTLLLGMGPARSSANNYMSLSQPTWTRGGQLLDRLTSEQFTADSACRCQSACLTRPDCLSASITELADGRVECRLSEHRGHPELLEPDSHQVELLERPGRSRLLDWCARTAECVTVGAKCSNFRCVCEAGLTADGQQCQCGESYGQPASGACKFRDCAELRRAGASLDGDYVLVLRPGFAVLATCDMNTDGGGWTLIQRRGSQAVDAFKSKGWEAYAKVFRNTDHFWLGNRLVVMLTSHEEQSLRVDLKSTTGETAHAEYESFRLGSEQESFALNVSGFRDGGAGDGLSRQNGVKFSTHDRTNGVSDGCKANAGWWTRNFCTVPTTLNGHYQKDHEQYRGAVWRTWLEGATLAYTKMMIRPKNFQAVDTSMETSQSVTT